MDYLFDFKIANESYVYPIYSNIILHIDRISHSVACLYFTNEMNIKISIPPGIVVYILYDLLNLQKRIIQSNKMNYYALCWNEKYDIEFNGKNILHIDSQKNWNIVCNSEL